MTTLKKVQKIEKLRLKMNVDEACKKVGLSTPTYYDHRNRIAAERAKEPKPAKVIVYQGKKTEKRKAPPAPGYFTALQVAALIRAVANG